MDDPPQSQSLPDGVIVRNVFVRERNVLISEADFGPLFVDYYLHCKDHGIRPTVQQDALFKDLLAAFTLHAASRPRNEVLAWTVRYGEPLVSTFFAADTELGTTVGRLFTDHVRPGLPHEMFQDLKRPGKPLHRSMVDFEQFGAAAAVERFYAQSEQRPGRYFSLEGDRALLLTAHPDFDEGWFHRLTLDDVRRLPEDEVLSPLETRVYRWFCGCGHDRILDVLRPMMEEDPDGLFGPDDILEVNCPRCAARYRVTREALEAKLAEAHGDPGEVDPTD